MSARSRFMAQSVISDRKHPKRARIDWSYYEKLANQETNSEAVLAFSEQAKQKIVDAMDLMARNSPDPQQPVKTEVLKKRARSILDVIKSLPDQVVLDNPHLVRDQKVFEQIRVHTTEEAAQGKTLAERTRIFLNLLRNRPRDVTMHLPSSEAMAAYEIRVAFRDSGMKAAARHTRPTTISEGCEPISAFEQFIFDIVMPEIGSDLNARKTLSRRLYEAEKAVERNG